MESMRLPLEEDKDETFLELEATPQDQIVKEEETSNMRLQQHEEQKLKKQFEDEMENIKRYTVKQRRIRRQRVTTFNQ